MAEDDPIFRLEPEKPKTCTRNDSSLFLPKRKMIWTVIWAGSLFIVLIVGMILGIISGSGPGVLP